MADLTSKTIAELPAASSLSDSDLFPISSGGATKKTLWSTIKSAISSFVSSTFFPLTVANGGTGASSAASARSNLGITFPLPVANGGTGAATVNAAKTALALGTLNSAQQSVTNNSSVTFSIENGESGFIVTTGAYTTAREFLWYQANSSGSVSYTALREATGITLTTGTNSLTLANSSGAFLYVMRFWY